MFKVAPVLLSFSILLSSISAFGQCEDLNASNQLINSGLAQYNNSQYGTAITEFTKAIGKCKTNGLAYYNRGLSKFYLKDYHGSIADCDLAVKYKAKDPNVYNIRGLCRQELKKEKDALEDFGMAIKLAPQSYWGFFNRGILHAKMGNFEHAVTDYSKSIEIKIDHPESYLNRGAAYFNLKKYDLAIADFNQASYMTPNNINIYYNRGSAKAGNQDFEGAVADFKKVLEFDARHAWAYYNLGACYSNMNEVDMACSMFKKAKEFGASGAKDKINELECDKIKEVEISDPNKINYLSVVNKTRGEIEGYLKENVLNLNVIEGVWSISETTTRNGKSNEEPSYGKVAIIKDDKNPWDFQAIFLEGAKYFPFSRVIEFNKTAYEKVFPAYFYAKDGTKMNWTFTIDDYGLLSSDKKYEEKGVQIYREIFFIKEFPLQEDILAAKGKDGVSESDGSKDKKEPSSGSGFLVSKDGYVGTNAHVVDGYDNVSIEMYTKGGGRKVYDAKVVYSDSPNDVALLRIKDKNFKPMTSLPYGLNFKNQVAEKVFTLGFPLAHVMGTEFKFNDGKVSSLSGAGDDRRYMQISVALQPGNSGGPLFNEAGDLIGIASARLSGGAQNVSYAMKIKYLNNLLLEEDGFNENFSGKGSLAGKDLKDQIQELKYYICLVRAFND